MSEGKENIRDPASALASPQFSEMLGKVLANPQIISAVASAVSGGGTEKKKEEPAAEASATPSYDGIFPDNISDKLPEIISVLGPVLSGKGEAKVRADDRRCCLLRAIKPYVSDSRQEAIEYMIKFSLLAELLRGRG